MITYLQKSLIVDFCFFNALNGVIEDYDRYSPNPLVLEKIKELVPSEGFWKTYREFFDWLYQLPNEDLLQLWEERVFPPGMERFRLIECLNERGLIGDKR